MGACRNQGAPHGRSSLGCARTFLCCDNGLSQAGGIALSARDLILQIALCMRQPLLSLASELIFLGLVAYDEIVLQLQPLRIRVMCHLLGLPDETFCLALSLAHSLLGATLELVQLQRDSSLRLRCLLSRLASDNLLILMRLLPDLLQLVPKRLRLTFCLCHGCGDVRLCLQRPGREFSLGTGHIALGARGELAALVLGFSLLLLDPCFSFLPQQRQSVVEAAMNQPHAFVSASVTA